MAGASCRVPEPQPPAPPAWGCNASASMAPVVAEAEEAAPHVLRINLQVHVHQHSAEQSITSEAQLKHFHPNDPDFHPCAFSPQGVDFGHKVVSRRYKAQKHVHSQYNMVTYTQCPSSAQAISHALTLHLSSKRSKNAIFLFGCSLKLASKSWPSSIYFTEIESLIRQLGPGYEYHRRKVKGRGFSLYFYVIKRMGVRFSETGRRNWNSLSEWALSLRDSVDNGSSSQVIPQVAAGRIGIAILGSL